MLLLVLTSWLERREREALAHLVEENRISRQPADDHRTAPGVRRLLPYPLRVVAADARSQDRELRAAHRPGGLASLLFGAMILTDSSVPELQVSLRLVLPIVLGVAGIAVFLGRMGVASQRHPAVTGGAAMIGQAGRALTTIEPGGVGRVATHGEIWTAIAFARSK
jgi:hypothetical protein